MHKYLIVLCVVIYLFSFSSLRALEVTDLYQASVPVDSQATKQRSAAIKEALRAVMVKVGGKQSILSNAQLKKAVNNYNTYVTQYRYTRNNRQLSLQVSFNEKKVNQLFQQANLPIWGSLRPQVLLWLIEEQGLNRTILSNSTLSNLPLVVDNFSKRRGLPINMPLMDLTDATQVSLSDLWGRFEQPIREASARYVPQTIVVMRLSNSSLLAQDTSILGDSIDDKVNESLADCGILCVEHETQQHLVLDWSLFSQQKRVTKQYQGTDQQSLVNEALSDITDLIYQHYALSTTANNEFLIDVANVDSLKVYTQVFDFLDDLSSVKSVTLVSAQGSLKRFELKLLGSQSAFLASLQLNKQLKQYIDPLAVVDTDAIPVFYWR